MKTKTWFCKCRSEMADKFVRCMSCNNKRPMLPKILCGDGQQLLNGATALEIAPQTHDTWVVLADTRPMAGPDTATPYAVWTLFQGNHCEHGHYFETLAEAAAYFNERAAEAISGCVSLAGGQ